MLTSNRERGGCCSTLFHPGVDICAPLHSVQPRSPYARTDITPSAAWRV